MKGRRKARLGDRLEVASWTRPQSDEAPPAIDTEIRIEVDAELTRPQRSDDRFIRWFFAIVVLIAGLAAVGVAVYYLTVWSTSGDMWVLPRWIYLLGLVGAIHVLYALFVLSVDDYSALFSLAVFLLVITCVYGFVGAAMAIDGGVGPVSRFLQVTVSFRPRATGWCGIMFGLSALVCYMVGREAFLWRRKRSLSAAAAPVRKGVV